MYEEFKIEKNIPITSDGRGIKRYPFDQMDIGDSFFIENSKRSNALYTSAKCQGVKIAIRKCVENGVEGYRVWRVK